MKNLLQKIKKLNEEGSDGSWIGDVLEGLIDIITVQDITLKSISMEKCLQRSNSGQLCSVISGCVSCRAFKACEEVEKLCEEVR